MSDLTRLSLTEASQLIRRRAVSSSDLTEATLTRIEATEPVVQAYALVLADRARRAAHHADRELAQGRWRGPLHGIPLAVKDICYMRDLPNEAGSRAMSGFVPGYDATVVRRLEESGAVIVGKTVTHEFAYGVNTPPTCTPWNLDCYPGGSSAGSGVAVDDRLRVRSDRDRYWRVHPDSRRRQRHRRSQTDIRPGQPVWRRSARHLARSRRTAHAHRRGQRGNASGHRRI